VRKSLVCESRSVLVLCLLALAVGLSAKSASAQTKPLIMSWGENVPSWNTELGITAMREACGDEPTTCEPYLDNLAALSNVKTYYVSMPLDPSTSVSWAKQYSTLSLTHKEMVEISFDDFVGNIEDDQIAGTMPNPASFVSEVIAATKSENPNLAFGVTIYEDGLNHVALTSLPASLLAQIQYVHLYLHYRQDAPNWSSYVATAKTLFPKAKIIAGAYPYDRIDYLPCAFKGTVSCTVAQEQSLYSQALQNQLNTLSAGTIYGVEFFFGYFGDPQDWPSWTLQTRICEPARLSQCYANTQALQNITLSLLQAQAAGASTKGTPAVSLEYSSVFMGSEYLGKEGSPGLLTMKNTGTAALAITGIDVAGADSTMFPMSQNCGTSLAAGASCTLTIYFKPSALGACTGEIIIYDNAPSGSQTVALTGTGIPSTTGTPAVTLAHTALYMGSEAVGVQGTPGLLKMTNSGTGALTISGFSITGTNSTNYSMTQNCGTSLAAGASCTLTIYFRPSATGTRTGSIVIKDNAAGGSQTVTLTGTGLS
jgi:hypothetical protein